MEPRISRPRNHGSDGLTAWTRNEPALNSRTPPYFTITDIDATVEGKYAIVGGHRTRTRFNGDACAIKDVSKYTAYDTQIRWQMVVEFKACAPCNPCLPESYATIQQGFLPKAQRETLAHYHAMRSVLTENGKTVIHYGAYYLLHTGKCVDTSDALYWGVFTDAMRDAKSVLWREISRDTLISLFSAELHPVTLSPRDYSTDGEIRFLGHSPITLGEGLHRMP